MKDIREKILLISARNFGDAIISSYLIKELKFLNGNISIDILTRPSFISIFRTINGNEINSIYTSEFPMGTMKNFGLKESIELCKRMLRLRKENYTRVINNIGDFRENFIGRVISIKNNYAVIWNSTHPFHSLIRTGFRGIISNKIEIPKEILNVYHIQDYIARTVLELNNDYEIITNINMSNNMLHIGIHPMASQKTRFWEYENWSKLINKLIDENQNIKISLFCSPDEFKEVSREFGLLRDKIEIIAISLSGFLNKLKAIDLFIGLDSFSIHSAYVMGVKKIIMLNGANDARVWAPPSAHIIEASNSCRYHPCYNKPRCIGTNYEYNCMKAIKVEDVLERIYKLTL